ncbi:proline-rich protein 2-like, partial [Diceros bicornis minor]|uniref:proline-rich protein 2-like n=1 Tax=Diceros bicornis minor TaxID=77932 RepID=UPI0026F31CEE
SRGPGGAERRLPEPGRPRGGLTSGVSGARPARGLSGRRGVSQSGSPDTSAPPLHAGPQSDAGAAGGGGGGGRSPWADPRALRLPLRPRAAPLWPGARRRGAWARWVARAQGPAAAALGREQRSVTGRSSGPVGPAGADGRTRAGRPLPAGDRGERVSGENPPSHGIDSGAQSTQAQARRFTTPPAALPAPLRTRPRPSSRGPQTRAPPARPPRRGPPRRGPTRAAHGAPPVLARPPRRGPPDACRHGAPPVLARPPDAGPPDAAPQTRADTGPCPSSRGPQTRAPQTRPPRRGPTRAAHGAPPVLARPPRRGPSTRGPPDAGSPHADPQTRPPRRGLSTRGPPDAAPQTRPPRRGPTRGPRPSGALSLRL